MSFIYKDKFWFYTISYILAILIFFPILDQNFGLYLENKFLSIKDLLFLLSVLFLSVIVSIFPSLKASKDSINEGI